MKLSRIIVVLLLPVLGFLGGWYVSKWPTENFARDRSTTGSAPEIVKVVAQGRILPKSGLINVLLPSGQRIEQLLVAEGDRVTAGKTELATYVGQDTLRLQSQLVESQGHDAERELAQKILSAQSNLLIAENSVAATQLQLQQVNSNDLLSVNEKQLRVAAEKLARLVQLASDPSTQLYVAQSAVEEQRLTIEQSQSQLTTARRRQESAVKSAELSVELAKKSRDQARILLSSLKELSAQNQTVTLTKTIADIAVTNAKLIAPIDGTVLKVFGKPGEVVVNSPLLQLGDLSQMICAAEVVDRLVAKIQLQQRVEIGSAALPRPLHGTIVEIGRVVGSGTLPDPNPLALIDRKTVEVRIEIDGGDNELASRLVNLQVTIEIIVDPSVTGTPVK